MTIESANALTGVWPVLVTPFNQRGEVDHDGLRTQVEWCLEAGAQGIVWPGVVSEFFTLSETERNEGLAVLLDGGSGSLPVVAGVSATSAVIAARLASAARDHGVVAVMAMAPYVQHFFAPSIDFITDYYARIADSCDLPLVLQNARIGSPLSEAMLKRVVEQVPGIRYIKEENFPSTHLLSRDLALVGGRVNGVFGGLGGVYLLEELQRGACGTMPSPAFADRIVEAFAAWQANDEARARAGLSDLAVAFNLELLYNVAFVKDVLKRRGLITSTATRVPAPTLDAVDEREIAQILDDLDLKRHTTRVA